LCNRYQLGFIVKQPSSLKAIEPESGSIEAAQIVLDLDNLVTTESEEIIGIDQNHNYWAVYGNNEAPEPGPAASFSGAPDELVRSRRVAARLSANIQAAPPQTPKKCQSWQTLRRAGQAATLKVVVGFMAAPSMNVTDLDLRDAGGLKAVPYSTVLMPTACHHY
jgi:hypothetical protein